MVAGLLFAGLAGTAAADSRIDCPLQQARRTITGNMANGWWTTPIVDRLSQTRIMNIGGKATLVCVYGNAGSVMREAPAGAQCRAVTGGFTCSGGAAPSAQVQPQIQQPAPTVQQKPTAPAIQIQPNIKQALQPPPVQQPAPQQGQPATYSTGGLKVPQTYMFDLDQGQVGQGAAADMWLEAKTAKDLYLTPRNGARMSISGARNLGRDGCLKSRLSPGSVPLAKLRTGTYVCVRTNEGRISEFRINGVSGGTLSLGYTTWQ